MHTYAHAEYTSDYSVNSMQTLIHNHVNSEASSFITKLQMHMEINVNLSLHASKYYFASMYLTAIHGVGTVLATEAHSRPTGIESDHTFYLFLPESISYTTRDTCMFPA